MKTRTERLWISLSSAICGLALGSALSAADWTCDRVLLDREGRTSIRLSEAATHASTPTVALGPGDSLLLVWQQLDLDGVSQLHFRFAIDGCLSPPHRVAEALPGSRLPAALWTGHDWVIAYEAQLVPEPLIRRIRVAHGSGEASDPRTVSRDGAVGARVSLLRNGNEVLYVWSEASRLEAAIEATEPTSDLAPLRRLSVHDFASGGVALRHTAVTTADGAVHVLATDRPKPGRSSNTGRIMAISRGTTDAFADPVALTSFRRERSDQAAAWVGPREPDVVQLAWVQQNQRRPDHFELSVASWQPGAQEPALQNLRLASVGPGQVHEPLLTRSRLLWRTGLPRSGPVFTMLRSDMGREGAIAQQLLGGLPVAQVEAQEDESGTTHFVFYEPTLKETHYSRLEP